VKTSTCCKLISGMFFFLVLTGWHMAWAQEKNNSDAGRLAEKPLHITSDKMIARQDDDMVEFVGNVKAVQEDSVLLAQSVKIYLYPSDQKSGDTKNTDQNRIKKIVASENVEYTAGERKAFADLAVYTTEDEVLVLTGKTAKLLTGSSWVTGTRITLFRKDDRAMVESDGKTRVQAMFNPEDKPSDQ
jgi:lipopolysaccharide transport protein LptA